MKKNQLFLLKKTQIRKWGTAFCICAFLVGTVSCIHGYDKDETFSSGVTGVTLESPDASTVTFTPSTEGDKVTITWKVVMGAGGYNFTLYNVDDPSNPVAVGIENEKVDGCRVTRPLAEDTKYKAVIKTLGNEEKNNKEASSAIEVDYSTLIPAVEVPPGDLTAYFAENEPESGSAYELKAGQTYTMSGDINFGVKDIIIRGDKVNRPVVNVGAKFVSNGGGLKLKFIRFDMETRGGEVIGFGDIPADAVLQGSSNYAPTSQFAIQSCEFVNVTKQLVRNTNGKKFAIPVFLVKDCTVSMKSNNDILFAMSGSIIINFSIANSTFTNVNSGDGNFFVQYSGDNPVKAGFGETGGITITNSTFNNIAYKKAFVNYSGMSQKYVTFVVKNTIFVDCGNNQVLSRMVVNTTPAREFANNNYWYNGAAANESGTDTSGTAFYLDPKFTNAGQGDLTVGDSELKTKRVGDPRWLPAVE